MISPSSVGAYIVPEAQTPKFDTTNRIIEDASDALVRFGASGEGSPKMADIDGDGDLEVVQACRSLRYSETSWVYVLDHDGKVASGWPKAFPTMVFLPPNLNAFRGKSGITAAPLRVAQKAGLTNAIVFVPGVDHWYDFAVFFSANSPTLDSDVVYAIY